jgi:hypothetical protein
MDSARRGAYCGTPPVPAIFTSEDGWQTERHAVQWRRNHNRNPRQSTFHQSETARIRTNLQRPMEKSSNGIETFQKNDPQK